MENNSKKSFFKESKIKITANLFPHLKSLIEILYYVQLLTVSKKNLKAPI